MYIGLARIQVAVDARAKVGAHLPLLVHCEQGLHRHRVRGRRGAHVHHEAAADRPAQVIHGVDLAVFFKCLVERGQALLAVQKQKPGSHAVHLHTFERARLEALFRVARVKGKEGAHRVAAQHRRHQRADSVDVPQILALEIGQLQLSPPRAGKQVLE